MNIKLKVVREEIRHYLPKYATPGSGAFDLRACVKEVLTLPPRWTVMVPTGIAIHIDNPGFAGFIFPRSGLGSKGLVLGNLTGVIDSDYQGEIMMSLWNRGNEVIHVAPMDRVAQLVIAPIVQVRFNIVEEFEASARGEGGFGSTGA